MPVRRRRPPCSRGCSVLAFAGSSCAAAPTGSEPCGRGPACAASPRNVRHPRRNALRLPQPREGQVRHPQPDPGHHQEHVGRPALRQRPVRPEQRHDPDRHVVLQGLDDRPGPRRGARTVASASRSSRPRRATPPTAVAFPEEEARHEARPGRPPRDRQPGRASPAMPRLVPRPGGTPHAKYFLFTNVGHSHVKFTTVIQTSMNLTAMGYTVSGTRPRSRTGEPRLRGLHVRSYKQARIGVPVGEAAHKLWDRRRLTRASSYPFPGANAGHRPGDAHARPGQVHRCPR